MALKQDVQAIKERVDLLSLVSRYVTLTKSGTSHKGRCPFHKDDTPSFMVNGEKGLWHCFGCGEGGDLFAFLMKIERLTFIEAAQRLAEEAGVSLSSSREDGEREKLRAVVAAVAEHYAANLGDTRQGARAREYLESRGFDEAAWKRYGLGYALPGWDNVKRTFGGRFGQDALLQAGLLVEGEKGTYDRFRDRTIFPIYDVSGRPVAFGGRAFEGEPKYLNSPTTTLFDKSRFLYGLHWARDAMRDARHAVLVEGYTDVLTLHQAGLVNAVGSMGTSLTQGQADLLGRLVEEVVIAYDRDTAGGAGAVRGMQILRNSGLAVRVARFAEDEDPDSLVRKHGVDAMRKAVQDAAPFHRFYLDSLAAKHDPSSVVGKERVLAEARDFYRGVRSLPLQQEIARGIADLLDLPAEGVAHELAARPARRGEEGPQRAETGGARWGLEEDVLALLLRGDVSWTRVAAVASVEDFSPAHRPIAEALANAPESPRISAWVVERLREQGYEAEAAVASYYALAPVEFADVERAFEEALDQAVRLPAFERKLADVETAVAAADAAGNKEGRDRLTRELNALALEMHSLVAKRGAQRGRHGRDQGKAQGEGAAEAR
jgi:DNA primase